MCFLKHRFRACDSLAPVSPLLHPNDQTAPESCSLHYRLLDPSWNCPHAGPTTRMGQGATVQPSSCRRWIQLLSPGTNTFFRFFFLFFFTNMFVAVSSKAQESATGWCFLARCWAGCGRGAGRRWVGPAPLSAPQRRLFLWWGHVGRMGLKAAPRSVGAHCSPGSTPCSTPRLWQRHPARATSTWHSPPWPVWTTDSCMGHPRPTWAIGTQQRPPMP